MENFTEGCWDDGVQGFISPQLQRSLEWKVSDVPPLWGKLSTGIQETSLNRQL